MLVFILNINDMGTLKNQILNDIDKSNYNPIRKYYIETNMDLSKFMYRIGYVFNYLQTIYPHSISYIEYEYNTNTNDLLIMHYTEDCHQRSFEKLMADYFNEFTITNISHDKSFTNYPNGNVCGIFEYEPIVL